MGLPRKPKPQRNEISLIVNLPLSWNLSSAPPSFFQTPKCLPRSRRPSIFRMLVPRTRNVNASKRLRSDTQDCVRTCSDVKNQPRDASTNFLHVSISDNGSPRKICSFFFLTIVIFACWSLRTKVNSLWEKLVDALPTKITNDKIYWHIRLSSRSHRVVGKNNQHRASTTWDIRRITISESGSYEGWYRLKEILFTKLSF